jgi:hypothetical protein
MARTSERVKLAQSLKRASKLVLNFSKGVPGGIPLGQVECDICHKVCSTSSGGYTRHRRACERNEKEIIEIEERSRQNTGVYYPQVHDRLPDLTFSVTHHEEVHLTRVNFNDAIEPMIEEEGREFWRIL